MLKSPMRSVVGVFSTVVFSVGLVAISSAPANATILVACQTNQDLWLLKAHDPSLPPETFGTCYGLPGAVNVYVPEISQVSSGIYSGQLNITTGAGFVEFSPNQFFNIATTTVVRVQIF